MSSIVKLETVTPRLVAAVRARAPVGGIAQAWKPALDQVWVFLRAHPELGPGHNLFLYHHPARREDPMDIDFGVEIAREFQGEGNVTCVMTPAGQAAATLHRGPYSGLPAAHDSIHAWCAANGRQIGGHSWEVYGDWTADDTQIETSIYYLLR